MMPNITLGGSPANLQQKGERSAKNGEIDGMRFDEALTIRSAERKATKGDGDDGPMDTRQDWKIDRYTALFRLDKTADGKAPSDTPAFGDFLGDQEASADPQTSAATGPEALVDNARAEPNLNGDDNAETDDASASTDLNIADATDAGPAFVAPRASTVREQAAKTAEPASVKTVGDQDAPKNPAIALGANAADADADDTHPRAAVQSEPPSTSKTQAAQVSAAERAAVPAAPADGQPARTRTAANAPVNAAVAEKPAPATQPPATIQQEGAHKPPPGCSHFGLRRCLWIRQREGRLVRAQFRGQSGCSKCRSRFGKGECTEFHRGARPRAGGSPGPQHHRDGPCGRNRSGRNVAHGGPGSRKFGRAARHVRAGRSQYPSYPAPAGRAGHGHGAPRCIGITTLD
ncbi:hypothetical protein [Neoaquamicrobium sediminum]|uniref:hypothetical protein n=1 Tax=Neoaquamicrobium sediminum TaxID=1849104 RepID=UPI001FD5AE9A|nr:hypothetical protein [Mesorhizobium sediminum]